MMNGVGTKMSKQKSVEENSLQRRGTRINQVIAAHRIQAGLSQKNTVALLVAECQSGKTGVAIELNNLFGADPMYGGCLVLQPSDNELGEQTKARFEGAYFDNYCGGSQNENNLESMCKGGGGSFLGILTPSSMTTPKSATSRGGRKSNESKKIIDRAKAIIKSGKLLFIIHDEGHANSTKSGKLNKFSGDMGLGLFCDVDIPTNVKILKLTATPGADITDLLNDYNNSGRLSLHYLNSTEEYSGLTNANNSGRLRETWKLSDLDGRNKFCDNIITPFIDDKRNGYIIARCTTILGAQELKSHILNSFKGKNINCLIYSSTPKYGTECINDFSKFFVKPKEEDIAASEIDQSSDEPDGIKVLIIIQSYRQGKTFDVDKHVLAWFGTNAGNDAANIQDIGRNFGYGKHGTHLIYTSLESVKRALELYSTAKQGGKNISPISSTTAIAVQGKKFKYGDADIESFDNEQDAKDAAIKYHLALTGETTMLGINGKPCNITVARVKDNNSTNIARSYLDGKYSKDVSHIQHDKYGYIFGITDLTEPNSNYINDYNQLPENMRGKFIYWRKNKSETIVTHDTKNSAYKN